jgi:hypothetical protein
LQAALQGDLEDLLKAELRDAERAVTAGIREATDGLKTELRRQITGAGLGTRLANTWRSEVYPKGQPSIGAAGYVWSKAPGLVRLYAEGALIRSKRGLFLAIPTPAAGRFGDGRQKITPGAWERIHGLPLRFIYRRGPASLLVAENVRLSARGRARRTSDAARARRTHGSRDGPPCPCSSWCRRSRLDVDGAARNWIAALPRLVVRNWQE